MKSIACSLILILLTACRGHHTRSEPPTASPTAPTAKISALETAKTITLPQFKVVDMPLEQAVRELEAAGKRLHAGGGVHLAISDTAKNQADQKVTLVLNNKTLADALAYLARLTRLQLVEHDHSLLLTKNAPTP